MRHDTAVSQVIENIDPSFSTRLYAVCIPRTIIRLIRSYILARGSDDRPLLHSAEFLKYKTHMLIIVQINLPKIR